MFMNATPFCLLLWGLMPEQSRLHFDWLQWAVAAAPLGLLVSAGMLVFLRFALHPGAGAAPPRERVQLQLAVLGPPSRRELSMLVILILTVIGWLLAPTWGVHMAVIAILGLVGAVVSGNFDRRALQDVDLNFLIFYGVTLSIARLWVDLGVDRLATGVVSQAITHVQLWPMAVVCGLGVLHVVLRFALPQPQAILVLGLALIPAAATLGVDAWIVAVTLLATSSPWFFPSQTITFPFALSASEGRLFSAGQARRASLGYVVVTLIGLAVCVPYWHALGLL
jgi:di/tricarboxylate transporter